jgi:hypothetical protein
MVAVTVLALGSVAACSGEPQGPSTPIASARSVDTSELGIPTPTLLEEWDYYPDAEFVGELGSFVENGKAYFTITHAEDGEVVGLVLALGYYASPDGKTLKWTNGDKDRVIAHVGDYIEAGGGTAGDETAALWDASEIPAGGLWLATTDISD